jgi:hypothetical protein
MLVAPAKVLVRLVQYSTNKTIYCINKTSYRIGRQASMFNKIK